MSAPGVAAGVLQRERRRVRGTPIVWALAASLYAAAAALGGTLGWWPGGGYAAAAGAILSLGALVQWWRRVPRSGERDLARELDSEWRLKARLEAAVELAGETSPLAAAQRADALGHVSGRGDERTRLWLAGVIASGLALSLLTTQGAVLGTRAWRHAAEARAKAAPEVTASIVWRSPAGEIKATAIEEIPFTAHAESTTGFRTLTLKVSVNGDHKLSRPLARATIEAAQPPGGHDLTDSLYMDELGVKEYDIVSYHLEGEYGPADSGRTTASPLQFVQVRPSRHAGARPRPQPGAEGDAAAAGESLAARLGALKREQVELMERTFAAGQGDAAGKAAATDTETLASEQRALADRTRELRQLASEAGAPPLIAENLDAAASRMQDAGGALGRGRPRDATPPQGRALSLLAACEKAFGAMAESGEGMTGGGTPNVDPFQERAPEDALTPREKTPAGRLEQLARRLQQANARAQPASAAGDGDGGREHAEIAREAEALARDTTIDGDARSHLGEAVRSIADATRHLERHDEAAAQEPAMAAEVALESAVQTQERVGRATAVSELDQAQRALNTASRQDAGARADELAQIRRALRSAAEAQQQAGSGEAARKLAELASTPGTATPERLREMASAAARAQVSLSPRAESFNRPLRQLARATQMPEGTGLGPILGELEVASQHAEWLTPDAGVVDSARRLGTLADRLQKNGSDTQALRDIATEAVRLSAGLEAARSVGRRDEVVRQFDPEHIDPAYRAAIEAYFERLSREGAARHAQPN